MKNFTGLLLIVFLTFILLTSNLFAAGPQPSITVISPNGGELWEVGNAKPFDITWKSTGEIGTISIFIKFKDGATGYLKSAWAQDGKTEVWLGANSVFSNIPRILVDGQYKIFIVWEEANGLFAWDQSDNYFSIVSSPLLKEDVVDNISSAYTKTAEGYTGECTFVVKTSRPFAYVSITLNGEKAEIEKVSTKANNSLILYSFPGRKGATISFSNSCSIEEEIKVTIRAIDGPADVSVSVNGVARAGCGYQQKKPEGAMGAPAKNQLVSKGKGKLPTTWGSIKH